jgi:DNA invertase Pin-like site-specific DNA recombinase
MCKLVAYYRVSTARQGRSGLGLEAQQAAVQSYAATLGKEVTEEFVEVESGKNAARPKLIAALELCELTGARLAIAKLDRLSRNVQFISSLMESGVRFTAVDMPEATELTIHIMAAMAQHERKMISERTRAALKAAKARGRVLGNPRIADARALRKAGRDMSMATQVRVRASIERAGKVMRTLEVAQQSGALTLRAMSGYLNTQTSIRTPRGALWTASAVSKVIQQAGK